MYVLCVCRCLVDLLLVNWIDVVDNWFGGCCCLFGGISEKLVVKYVKFYRCVEGICLLIIVFVIFCKNDVIRFKFLEMDRFIKFDDSCFINIICNFDNDVDVCVSCLIENILKYDFFVKVDLMYR